MEIEVVTSNRRVKTAQLVPTESGVRVTVPASASADEQQRLVGVLVRRHQRATRSNSIDLMSRARQLANKHGFELPNEIRWVDNQTTRWGSCTPGERSIRISSVLNDLPLWVLDSVIAHELAHLTHRKHNASFWRLANRYPLMERAKGFLLATQFKKIGVFANDDGAASANNTAFDESDSTDEGFADDVLEHADDKDVGNKPDNAVVIEDNNREPGHIDSQTEVITLPFGEYDAVDGVIDIRT